MILKEQSFPQDMAVCSSKIIILCHMKLILKAKVQCLVTCDAKERGQALPQGHWKVARLMACLKKLIFMMGMDKKVVRPEPHQPNDIKISLLDLDLLDLLHVGSTVYGIVKGRNFVGASQNFREHLSTIISIITRGVN